MKEFFISLIIALQISGIKGVPLESSEAAYALNVVYFLPGDMQPVKNYKQRLSDLLLYTQDFYRKEMIRNGFGNKTFGLRKEADGRVKILVIRGLRNAAYYPYEGGGWKAQQEIESWFADHPEDKTSEHTLVFMPTTTGDKEPGGVPFYGLGKICFALDYADFDLSNLGSSLLTKWLGGMAHELGHGLNLPHNRQTVSAERKLGTALMGAGNYTFGMTPTFLTQASCAILNNCQVFARSKGDFYLEDPSINLHSMHIEFKETTVDIRLGYQLSLPCNGINIYYDNAPFGEVNTDYDAEAFFIRPGRPDSFAFSLPKKELFAFGQQDFQIRMLFLFENGTTHSVWYNCRKDSIVDYHFTRKREWDKKGWSAIASDFQPDSPAANVLDGKSQTIWHSEWAPTKIAFPHVLTVAFDKIRLVRGISAVQRSGMHGAVKDFVLSVRKGKQWKEIGIYQLRAYPFVQYIDLPKPMKIDAYKLEMRSNYSPDDPLVAAIAELGAY